MMTTSTALEKSISGKNQEIANAQDLIKKYEEQQNNVRNNREYDSLSKEIEFQTLEIELCEKRIREFTVQIEEKKLVIEESSRCTWMSVNWTWKTKRRSWTILSMKPGRKRM